MAKLLFLAAQTLLFIAAVTSSSGEKHLTTPNQTLHTEQRLTHLRFYWHDVVSGPNPSSVMIQKPVLNSSLFRSITMMDDPLTSNISKTSAVIGQAQGIYAGADQTEIGFLMVMNFVFKFGKFNGSSITILGQNKVKSTIREMPVIGGTGIFRFARGYVEARTKSFDLESGNATVEYNCYVLHF